jgi:putative membrane-bound dehydrogenase-like protein
MTSLDLCAGMTGEPISVPQHLGGPRAVLGSQQQRRSGGRVKADPGGTLAFLVLAVGLITGAGAAQFKFPEQTFTLPDGFEIERVAGPGLVDRPISADFDEQGRLYVTDSSGSNDKPLKQLEDKPHRVVRLEDTDGDGKFDKTVVFADKMMFPEGCLWFDGSLYVAAPPSIWKLTDANGDGVAETREEWHQGKTLTGCANDLHGPYLGLDGWLYWCKGAFDQQTYDLPNGKPFVSRAAHILRARPDHSGLEPVLTGGMDNPVGVAFTPQGERILCGTFFVTHEPGHRDGLIHAIYGGVYGKINEVTDSHKKTGDLMPIMTHMGPAAPCSVISYQSQVLGADYKNNLFVCAFNLHKVSRHVLEPDGATFKTRDTDFLSSDNSDFHPTQVLEDADGSLLVFDTGGWYKICCPTSQLSKPDVLGAIYRIRKKGIKGPPDPRGLSLNWSGMKPAELGKLLGDERPAVRSHAIAEFAKLGKPGVSAAAQVLKKSDSNQGRLDAVWALTRVDAPAARAAIRAALDDQSENVRSAALHSISLWRDAEASRQLRKILFAPGPANQRIAAEALGRIGNKNAVPALLEACAQNNDRVLEHSLIHALIEINDPQATVAAFKTPKLQEQRAALIALDQMDHGVLSVKAAAPLLASPDPALRRAAAWVAGHHPEWGGPLSLYLHSRMLSGNLGAAERADLQQQLTTFARTPAIQDAMAAVLNDPGTAPAIQQLVLNAMADAGLKEVPAEWPWAVRSSLAVIDEAVLHAAVSAARVLGQVKTNAPNFADVLLRIARDEKKPADLRLEALAAIPGTIGRLEPEVFTFVCSKIEPDTAVLTRSAAVGVLTRAKLDRDQLLTLTDTLKEVGPLEMTRLLTAFERSPSEEVGVRLISALKESKGQSSLRPDLVKTVFAKYPPSVRDQSQDLLKALSVDTAKQAAHLDELLPLLKDGDIRRGQLIFNSQKAACSACHTVGYLGGKVGPDLTTIGQVRTERDLLESIVYPSASFVRSFEPYIITTKSDETLSGVLKKDAPDEVVLATGPGAESRIARSDITDLRPGAVSVMPAGLEEQLTKQDLADLLEFLKSTKWGPR